MIEGRQMPAVWILYKMRCVVNEQSRWNFGDRFFQPETVYHNIEFALSVCIDRLKVVIIDIYRQDRKREYLYIPIPVSFI